MLFGAGIGASINNIPLAIILALLGHYFLDLFPHIEYLDGVENSIKKLKTDAWKKSIKNAIKVFLDFCLGILAIFLFSKNQPIIYVCAIMAIIPDGLTVIYSLFPNRPLAVHHKIHGEKIHFLRHKKIPKIWRIATQVGAVALSIVLLMS